MEKADRTLEKRELTLILLDCFAVNLSALGSGRTETASPFALRSRSDGNGQPVRAGVKG